ncbi:dihydrofolate reductase family protein [Rhodococcus qingshengii]|uniref:dihydrofolate reductase family protein n=1 Tax=Rhodococcus qingshengii TaxID=334542 RepID=UPI001F2C6485|nr:dihydrofolate reductase family protein [Rhodococcus qingshengii]
MKGDTTFHFRSAAIEDVLTEATEAADDLDMRVGGGYRTARNFLHAGLIDDLHLLTAPIFLGRGHRLWDDLRGFEHTHTITTEITESGTIHATLTR